MTTFNEFARSVLDQRREDGIRGITRELSRYRVHIEPADFASMPIETVEGTHIADWLRDMSRKQPRDNRGQRTLARGTINRSSSLVSVIFNEAVQARLRKDNPCIGQKLKKRSGTEATRETWAFLTLDEQKQIASCTDIPIHDRLAIQFAYLTGLRQGEQRHLQVKDVVIDDASPHIIVRYASRSPKGELLPPKSGKIRRVPLLPEAQEVTREWLTILPSFAPSNPHDLMWPTSKGTYRCEGKPLGKGDTLKRHYRTAGIELRPYLHWHSLRHTFCSSLVSGVWGRRWTLEEVRVVAGHSSVLITSRYSHHAAEVIAQAARETAIVVPTPIATLAPTIEVVEEERGIFRRLRDAFRTLRGVA